MSGFVFATFAVYQYQLFVSRILLNRDGLTHAIASSSWVYSTRRPYSWQIACKDLAGDASLGAVPDRLSAYSPSPEGRKPAYLVFEMYVQSNQSPCSALGYRTTSYDRLAGNVMLG